MIFGQAPQHISGFGFVGDYGPDEQGALIARI